MARLWGWFRGLPIIVQLLAAILLLFIAFRILSALFGGDDGTRVASRSTTTVRRTIPTTTTRPPPPLPPGDDRTVKNVLDGDSFELTDGTKIRLIGIDAPDIEVDACFSSEATAHLKELLPADKGVRLVYDTTRTDRFGRTLAYVYRLPDGLFVNVAMVRDGFARDMASGANTAHAEEIATALSDARTAQRGLWQACQSTTTAARPATTRATVGTTPTTEPETTTSASVDTSTTTTMQPPLTILPTTPPTSAG
jgi:micrococcal nuclease